MDDHLLYCWLFLVHLIRRLLAGAFFQSSLPAYLWMHLAFIRTLRAFPGVGSRVGIWGVLVEASPGSWRGRAVTSCCCYGCLSLIEGLMGLDWLKRLNVELANFLWVLGSGQCFGTWFTGNVWMLVDANLVGCRTLWRKRWGFGQICWCISQPCLLPWTQRNAATLTLREEPLLASAFGETGQLKFR